ncbi:MAG: polyhydroxyalkanoate synthesis repressor PhaR [Alphaproteobacteria bacterium]|nr:polyhydroxyalkanoate synthesis repressor PhaR [Alphaproteobacteria bacterium]
MAEKGKGADGPITIKKYANRRLYNTATSSYVTLDHLCQMVKDRVEFTVFDAKTGEDITRSVLTQIIVEEEAKGENLLPIGFLRQIIGFYGDSMQKFLLPQYLDVMMQSFEKNRTEIQRHMSETFGSVFPFGQMEEMSKQNIALFEQAMKMFTGGQGAGKPAERPEPEAEAKPEAAPADSDEIRRELEELKRQVSELSGKKRG